MNLSVNGQSKVPPGFRFHPTEEELLQYYLNKKVASEKIDLDVIQEIDLNKLEPWDIQEKCRIGSTPQNDWYLFSHKDKKYPTGIRTNRATPAGFWKATGRDKVIYSNCRRIGMRKTLVFYKGRAPHGEKSDWIMHEYRLEDHSEQSNGSTRDRCMVEEAGWVVCRVFRKKNFQKVLESPGSLHTSTDPDTHLFNPCSAGVLNQILYSMGKSCWQGNNHDTSTSSTERNINFQSMSQDNDDSSNHIEKPDQLILNRLAADAPNDLPPLINGSPSINHDSDDFDVCYDQQSVEEIICGSTMNTASVNHGKHGLISDWITLDRLVACALNGQAQESCFQTQLQCFGDPGPLAANTSLTTTATTTTSAAFSLSPDGEGSGAAFLFQNDVCSLRPQPQLYPRQVISRNDHDPELDY